MPDEGGPYVAAAVFCEKVLEEKDGVLSAVRAVDRFIVQAPADAPETLPPGVIGTAALIMLKHGPPGKELDLKLRRTTPSGKKSDSLSLQVFFPDGPMRGVNVKGDVTIAVEEEGVNWFDVLLDDQLLTRMPLEIVYARQEPESVAGEGAEDGGAGVTRPLSEAGNGGPAP